MIVIDIGNTNTVIGIYKFNRLINIKRFKTINLKIFKLKIENYFQNYNKKNYRNNLCVLASVVPKFNSFLKLIAKKYNLIFFNLNSNNLPFKLRIKYDRKKIGADRIANIIAINKDKIKNCIIIDFGTATTFDVIKNNVYEGGLIFPGINISHNALIDNAALLKKIKIVKVNKIVANNTNQSIQSGFYWGYLYLINGIVKKIIKEKKFKPNIILTGGLANIFKSKINFNPIINENLTLEGLAIIGKKIYNAK